MTRGDHDNSQKCRHKCSEMFAVYHAHLVEHASLAAPIRKCGVSGLSHAAMQDFSEQIPSQCSYD